MKTILTCIHVLNISSTSNQIPLQVKESEFTVPQKWGHAHWIRAPSITQQFQHHSKRQRKEPLKPHTHRQNTQNQSSAIECALFIWSKLKVMYICWKSMQPLFTKRFDSIRYVQKPLASRRSFEIEISLDDKTANDVGAKKKC